MSNPALPAASLDHLSRSVRRARSTRERSASAWANVVLAVGTVAALLHTVVLVAVAWGFAWAYDVVTGQEPGSVDVLGAAVDLAPALLVGWCLGRAAAAALEQGEALPPAGAGVAAGALGVVAGAAVLALTGPL